MRPLRTAQDIRTAPKGSACRGPATEQWAYASLTRLARERQRLLSQQASWQRRLGRITRRLAEIDAQAERLHRQLPERAAGGRFCAAAHRGRRSSSLTDQPC